MTAFEQIPNADFHAMFKKFNIVFKDLPESLKELIWKFEKAMEQWQGADKNTQEKLTPILIKTSAVVGAEISKTFQQKPIEVKIEKLRLLELEAKARELEIRKRKGI